MNPYQVVKDFETALCEYTGAKYAVTTNSCTMAILLAVKYQCEDHVSEKMSQSSIEFSIPKKTYVSVPMSIIHAGGNVSFNNVGWWGQYEIEPLIQRERAVWDSARYFTSSMYRPDRYQCVSFHATKILGDTQGGAILHDDDEADHWFRKARFDGRTEGVAPSEDDFTMVGYHCYMSPDVAARLLLKLSVLPKYNDPLPNDDYPDLSQFKVFQ